MSDLGCRSCGADLREVGYYKSTAIEERVPYSCHDGVWYQDDPETVNNGGGTTYVCCGSPSCHQILPDGQAARLEALFEAS